jgi:hypothetical protein
VQQFCRSQSPFSLPLLSLAFLGSFFCLVPSRHSPQLETVAAQTVHYFEPFRAPLSAVELKRRMEKNRLTPLEQKNLLEFGYPYVFSTYRFHMTLTGRLEDVSRRGEITRSLLSHFSPALEKPLLFDAVSLVREPEPNGQFELIQRYALQAVKQDVV